MQSLVDPSTKVDDLEVCVALEQTITDRYLAISYKPWIVSHPGAMYDRRYEDITNPRLNVTFVTNSQTCTSGDTHKL